MKKTGAVLILILILAITGCARQKPGKEINVFAASSLNKVLYEVKREYEKEHPGVTITLNLGASGMLQKQIEQGAPADIFISAGEKQMDELESEGLLLAGSRLNVASNELVLAVPGDSTAGIRDFADLASPRVKKIALGLPETVPAGKYGKETLTFLKVWGQIEPKLVFAKDVNQVKAYLESGNVDAGLLYKSDVAVEAGNQVKVKIVAVAPSGSHKPIVYPAAVMASSREKEEGKKILEFFKGSKGQRILAKYSFLPPEEK